MNDKILAKFKELSSTLSELYEAKDNWYATESEILRKRFSEPNSGMKPSEYFMTKYALDLVALKLILKLSE